MATAIPQYERNSQGYLQINHNSTIFIAGSTGMYIDADEDTRAVNDVGLIVVKKASSTGTGSFTIKKGTAISAIENKTKSCPQPIGAARVYFIVLDDGKYENLTDGFFHVDVSTDLLVAYFTNK